MVRKSSKKVLLESLKGTGNQKLVESFLNSQQQSRADQLSDAMFDAAERVDAEYDDVLELDVPGIGKLETYDGGGYAHGAGGDISFSLNGKPLNVDKLSDDQFNKILSAVGNI